MSDSVHAWEGLVRVGKTVDRPDNESWFVEGDVAGVTGAFVANTGVETKVSNECDVDFVGHSQELLFAVHVASREDAERVAQFLSDKFDFDAELFALYQQVQDILKVSVTFDVPDARALGAVSEFQRLREEIFDFVRERKDQLARELSGF